MKSLLALSALVAFTTAPSYSSSLQGSLSFSGSASSCGILGPPGTPVVCDFATGINETLSSSTGSVMQSFFSQGVTGAGGGTGIDGYGGASASLGSVSASVFVSTGGGGGGYLCSIGSLGACALISASGSASFGDDLFVDTGLGGGTIQYSLEYTLMIGGTASNDTGGGTASFNGRQLPTIPGCVESGVIGNPFGTCIVSVPFTDGVAIPISGAVTATAFGSSAPMLDGSGEGSLTIQSITVLNSDGTPISNFDWSSSSGSSYAFVGGTELPEPGGFLLTFSALFVLMGRCFLKSLPHKL